MPKTLIFTALLILGATQSLQSQQAPLEYRCWLDAPGKDETAELLCLTMKVLLLKQLQTRDYRPGDQRAHIEIELALRPIYVEDLRVKTSEPDGYAIHQRFTLPGEAPADYPLVCGAYDEVGCEKRVKDTLVHLLQKALK